LLSRTEKIKEQNTCIYEKKDPGRVFVSDTEEEEKVFGELYSQGF
jgi:hypothetical protein